MPNRYRCFAPLHISASPIAKATVEVHIIYEGPEAGIYTDSENAPKYAYTCSTIAHAFYMWEIRCERHHEHRSPPLPNIINGTIRAWCAWRNSVNKEGDCGYVPVDEDALEAILERLRKGLEQISEALMREQNAHAQPERMTVERQRAPTSPFTLGGAYRVTARVPSSEIWQDVPLAPPPPPPSSNRPTSHRTAPPSPIKPARASRSPAKKSQPVESPPLPIFDISSDEDEVLYANARASPPPARRPSPSKPRATPGTPTSKAVEAVFPAKGKGVAFSTTAATVRAPRARSSSPRKPRTQASVPATSPSTPSSPAPPPSLALSASVTSLTDAPGRRGLSESATPAQMIGRWWIVCQDNGVKRTTKSLVVAQAWLAEAEVLHVGAELKVAENEDELAAILRIK
ncbi:hypothetical protein EV121DRAFT_297254 [Schizophyllum commune]